MSKRTHEQKEDGVSSAEARWVDRRIAQALRGPSKYYTFTSGFIECVTWSDWINAAASPTQVDVTAGLTLGTGASNRLSAFVRIQRCEIVLRFTSPYALGRTPVAYSGQDYHVLAGVVRNSNTAAGVVESDITPGLLYNYAGAGSWDSGAALNYSRFFERLYTLPASQIPDPFPYSHLKHRHVSFPGKVQQATVVPWTSGPEQVGGITGGAVPPWTFFDSFNRAQNGSALTPAYSGVTPTVPGQTLMDPKSVAIVFEFGGEGLPVVYTDGEYVPQNKIKFTHPGVSELVPSNNAGKWAYEYRIWFNDDV